MKKYGRFSSLVTVEQVRELALRHTDVEIGTMFNVTPECVGGYRKRHGIDTKNPRQRKDAIERVGKLCVEDLTPTKLQDLYIQMPAAQIAQLVGISKPGILKRLRQFGIKPISKTARLTATAPLTQEQRDVLIGTVLGDGHISARGMFQVVHAHWQYDYLKRIHSILSPHSKPLFYVEKVLSGSDVETYGFGFRTVMHETLRELREVFYPSAGDTNVKVFPDSILQNLSACSLAYWYFDDGHLEGGLPSFALGAISEEAALRVVNLVGQRFGLNTHLKCASGNCQVMGVRAVSADLFFALIQGKATEDMLYKLPSQYWPVGMLPKRYTKKTEYPLPSDISSACSVKSWHDSAGEMRSTILDRVVSYWSERGFPQAQADPSEISVLGHIAQEQVLQDGQLKGRNVGQNICYSFMPHIWSARSYGSPQSPDEIFKDPQQLRKVITLCYEQGRLPTPQAVRNMCRSIRFSGVYNFRPAIAKILVDRYCPSGGVVWDPCSGYGGRLLGTVLSRSRAQYIGCDPQRESNAGLVNMVDWLDGFIPGVRDRVRLHCIPAEDFTLEQDVDLVMTSPPYWKREDYRGGQDQSSVRYSASYSSWLEGFWKPVIEKAIWRLKPGGWLVLNVDDFKIDSVLYSLISDTIQIVKSFGFGDPKEQFAYMMPRPGNSKNQEQVLCWVSNRQTVSHKVFVAPTFEVEQPVSPLLCSSCGRVTSVKDLLDGKCTTCRVSKEHTSVCAVCGSTYQHSRVESRFCSGRCYAKDRYYRTRKPPTGFRTFTCVDCGVSWTTDQQGTLKRCPSCKEQAGAVKYLLHRDKVCGYRLCGKSFTDTSAKASMSYCCSEHRRREKVFRSGLVTSDTQFRKPDPVL